MTRPKDRLCPVRIGDLIAEGKLLWVYCRACGQNREFEPAALGLPPGLAVPDAGAHFKCSQCGSRKITTWPEIYPGGLEAARAKYHEPPPE